MHNVNGAQGAVLCAELQPSKTFASSLDLCDLLLFRSATTPALTQPLFRFSRLFFQPPHSSSASYPQMSVVQERIRSLSQAATASPVQKPAGQQGRTTHVTSLMAGDVFARFGQRAAMLTSGLS